MALRTHPPKRIAEQLAAAKRLLDGGETLKATAEQLGVKYQTLYSRIKRYEVRAASGSERIVQLERENAFLREALATLDIKARDASLQVRRKQRKR